MLKNLSVTNMLYGIGAAIVILGALFKIQHWNGGGLLLTIGMITEAVVFIYSAFEQKKEEINTLHVDTSGKHLDIIKAQQEYIKEIKNNTRNIALINTAHKDQLKFVDKAAIAYKKIHIEADSLAKHTNFLNKTYYSILKAMKS